MCRRSHDLLARLLAAPAFAGSATGVLRGTSEAPAASLLRNRSLQSEVPVSGAFYMHGVCVRWGGVTQRRGRAGKRKEITGHTRVLSFLVLRAHIYTSIYNIISLSLP